MPGQISLGHAGLLAAGAFTAGILFKEFNAPFWVTLPAAALVGALLGVMFGLPSLRLRGLYLAVSTLALHFVVVYLGGEYETKRGFSTGILIDPPTIGGWHDLRRARLVFHAARVRGRLTLLICLNLLRSRTGRAWRAIHANETVAEALGIGVAALQAARLRRSRSALTAVAGALFAYYRGFVSVEAFSLFLSIQYVAMIIIGGMGSLLGAMLGAVFVTLFPYAIEAALMRAAGRAALCRHAVRRELRRLRRGDDPVPGVRAAGPGRHLAARADLFPAVAVQAPAAGGAAPMSEPLLTVDKLEVVYQRAITAVQGITLSAQPRPDRRAARHQRRGQDHDAARDLRLPRHRRRARHRGHHPLQGPAHRERPPHEIARLGIALVPEREKVFPNLTVAENLAAPLRRVAAASGATARSGCIQFFPQARATCATAPPGCSPAASGRCWRSRGALVCRPELLLVDELSLGLAPVVVEDLMARAACRSGASSASPSCWSSRAPRSRSRSPTTATCWRTAASCSTATPRACASHQRHPGVLSRPGQRRRTPQLPRRQAVPPQPEVVWLSSRSTI